MHKVISINLNGNAYQLDETAYETLRAYLDRAEAVLKDNPDRAEIVADLEQAIAEKCNKVLGPHKTVVTAAEIEQVIKEMGPVESGTEEAGEARREPGSGTDDQSNADTGAPKRLYNIREGAVISGVCNGLAAYLGIDVTIIRIVFVIFAIITKGAWIGVYFLAMFVIPYARTSEQRAAARGLPFNAQEVIDQAMKNVANFKAQSKDWKRHWRRQHRHWRQHARRQRQRERQWWDRDAEHGAYSSQVLAGMMTPLLGLYSAGLFVLLIVALVSLVEDGRGVRVDIAGRRARLGGNRRPLHDLPHAGHPCQVRPPRPACGLEWVSGPRVHALCVLACVHLCARSARIRAEPA